MSLLGILAIYYILNGGGGGEGEEWEGLNLLVPTPVYCYFYHENSCYFIYGIIREMSALPISTNMYTMTTILLECTSKYTQNP